MERLQNWIDFDLLSIEEMTRKLLAFEDFSLSRYGDGEFDAMLKPIYRHMKVGEANCDNHKYYPDMGKALRESLIGWNVEDNPNHYAGIHFSDRIGSETTNWLLDNGFSEKKPFTDNSVFHIALVEGKMDRFYEALKSRKVVLVGPRRLKQQSLIKVEEFIEVPDTNSWLDRIKVWNKLLSLDLFQRVVIFCSGPPTPVFINDLPRKDKTLIDFGSTLDPNVGVHSRSFHKKLKKKLLK